jgi:hypothetical protein
VAMAAWMAFSMASVAAWDSFKVEEPFMVTCKSMNHRRPTRQRARRPDAHGVGVLPPPKVPVGGKGTQGVGGEPNRCSAAHSLTLAKIELMCYYCKRSQKESARKLKQVSA